MANQENTTIRPRLERDMPCGCCDAGVYALGSMEDGLRLFGACGTETEARAMIPKCKHARRPCVGCTHFVDAMKFPINADEIRRQMHA
jgi:hypothetical protein